jgi:cytochrome c oxidase subunit 2
VRGKFVQLLPTGISTFSKDIDDLILTISVFSIIAFVISQAALIGFSLSFRRKKGAKAGYIKGTGWGQMKWVLIPVILVALADFAIDFQTHTVWEKIMGRQPQSGERISITGSQFLWRFAYAGPDGKFGTEDDKVSINELRIPVDKTIIFSLEATDVVHSFFIPATRFKQDAIPGRKITRWFSISQKGTYDIMCTELCGVGHSAMYAKLIVQDEESYVEWLTGKRGAMLASTSVKNKGADTGDSDNASLMRTGEALVKSKGCVACHSLEGSRGIGPWLNGLLGREVTLSDGTSFQRDDAYLKSSISNPSLQIVSGFPAGMMPKLPVSDSEINAIATYLKSLK